MPDISSTLARLSNHDATLTNVELGPGSSDDHDVDIYPLLARDLADNSTVRAITIQELGPTDDDGIPALVQTFKTMKSLKELTLKEIGLSSEDVEALASVLPEIPALERLNLCSNGLGDDSATILSTVLGKCQNLHVIELGGNQISDTGALALSEVLTSLSHCLVSLSIGSLLGKDSHGFMSNISSLENLSTLDLSGNKSGSAFANALAAAIPSLSLSCLNLVRTGIGPRGAKAILPVLARDKNMDLRELYLGGCRLGFFGTKTIAAVGLPVGLEVLDLSNNDIGDDGAWQLTNSIMNLNRLTKLDLSSNAGFGDDAVAEVGRLLPNMQNLSSLDLSKNSGIGDAGVEVLASSLSSTPTLKVLNLSATKVADVGASVLGRALAEESCPLVCLMLGNCKIGEDGANEMMDALDDNKTLLTLDLSGNDISASRMTILDMLLKHRKPATASTSGTAITPEKLRARGVEATTPVSPGQQAVAAAASPETKVALSIDPNIVKECQILVGKSLSTSTTPAGKIASEFVVHCTKAFDPRNLLNYGALGDLFGCSDGIEGEENDKYAIRQIMLTHAGVMKEIRHRVVADIASLKQSNPPNFVPMVAYSIENVAGEEEYCFLYNLGSNNTSLNELLADDGKRHQMTWPIRVRIMRDMASAVNFLHNGGEQTKRIRPCFHGDIKSSNCFVDEETFTAKLVDCGLSRLVATDRAKFKRGDVVFGSRSYRCPRYERGAKYTNKSDIFSLGICFAEIIGGVLQGHVDAKSEQVQDYYYQFVLDKKITLDGSAGPIGKNAAGALCRLALACMSSEPEKRPPASAILQMLDEFAAMKEIE